MQPIIATYIEIRPNRQGQHRAFVAGTRVRVQDIYADSEIHGKTPEQIAEDLPHLSLAQVHAALAFFFDNRETILNEIREDQQFVELMKTRTGPGPLAQKLTETDADDAVPSG